MSAQKLVDVLKPCPFCGREGDLDQWPCDYIDGTGANVVRCVWCHGAAPMKTWNRRARDAAVERLIASAEALRQYVHDEADKYEDDGSNEPLEAVRAFDEALAAVRGGAG